MEAYATGVSSDDATTPAVTTDYRFAQIPEAVLYDHDLSPQAVRVYGTLMRHGSDPANCYPSHERIGELLGVSARSIQRPVAELVKARWIAKTKRFNRRGERTSDGYHVYTHRADLRAATAQELPVVHRAKTSEEREPVPNEKNQTNVVLRIFDAWKESTGKARATLTDERRRLIEKWLKDYPETDLIDAVRGWQWSPWHHGHNERKMVYNDIGLFLRNAANIEKFRDWERGIDRPAARPGKARPDERIDNNRAGTSGRVNV